MDKMKMLTVGVLTAIFATVTVYLASACADRAEETGNEVLEYNTYSYSESISTTDIEGHISYYEYEYFEDSVIETLPEDEESRYKIGSKGEYVKELQSRLIGLGFLDDVADGIYGSKTAAAVAEFQRCIGVEPDGEVDCFTEKRLLEVDTPHAPGYTASDYIDKTTECSQNPSAEAKSTTAAARPTSENPAATSVTKALATVSTTYAKPAQKGRECEPNDTAVKATRIELNDSCIGYLSDKSDDDWYYIELELHSASGAVWRNSASFMVSDGSRYLEDIQVWPGKNVAVGQPVTFSHVYGGSLAKKMYRLYEYEKVR